MPDTDSLALQLSDIISEDTQILEPLATAKELVSYQSTQALVHMPILEIQINANETMG